MTKPSAVHLDLDAVGVAGERLVHRVVDHLGEQVMQRLLVGAADIHAGPAAHRLQPLQHLDVARRVAGLAGGAGLAARGLGGRAARRREASANRSRRRPSFWRSWPFVALRWVGNESVAIDYATAGGGIVTFASLARRAREGLDLQFRSRTSP